MAEHINAAGLIVPAIETLQDRIATEQRTAIDPLLANDPDSALGTINAIVASQERETWEALQASAWVQDPDAAEAARLTKLSRLTGTQREGPTKSKVSLILNLAPGGYVTAGVSKARITDSDPQVVFTITESVTNGSGVNIFPTVAAEADLAGPTAANAGTITTIHASPSVGWIAVSNPTDAVPGSLEEIDPALRARRRAELRGQGAATPTATEANFVAYRDASGATPILACKVYENVTSLPHALGVPPYTFWAIVWDGPSNPVPSTVLDALLAANRSGGTPGAWFRPTQKPVDVRVTVKIDVTAFAGEAALKQAVADRYDLINDPGDVFGFGHAFAAAFAVAGVSEVPLVEVKFASSPTWLPHTDLVLSGLEIATVDVSNVSVVYV